MDWVQWSIKPTTTDGFNAGTLVIDKTWWQEHQVTEALFDLTRKVSSTGLWRSGGILNLYFKMRGFHYLGPIIYK